MFNIIFPVIIFVSLAVIVFIVGKHLPEFVDVRKEENGQSKKRGYFKKIARNVLGGANFFLMWLIEQVIKIIKNFLNLIQSWISENKKDKSKDSLETFSQRTEISEDNFLKKIATKNSSKEDTEKKENSFNQKENQKEGEPKKSKGNFFITLKDNIKERILEKKRQKINQVFQESEEPEEDSSQFSDGIVKIHKRSEEKKGEEKSLISEVVEIKKNQAKEMDLDEDIGVDRHILEKKLINKIAQNPKDKEIYRQLGELYLKMKNYSDAEACYRQILKIAVRDVDAGRKVERIRLLKRS